MSGRLDQFRKLGAAERLNLIGFAVALPVISLMLKLAGFARSRRLSNRLCPGPTRPPTPAELAHAESLARLVSIAGRHGPVHVACLGRAMLLELLLRRKGLDAQLVLGVRIDDRRELDAHAWVQLGDRALGEAQLRHSPFPGQARPTS